MPRFAAIRSRSTPKPLSTDSILLAAAVRPAKYSGTKRSLAEFVKSR